MADFRSRPGAKRGTRLAATWIALPFRGLRTLLALRCETPKVPNPESVTRSPLMRLAWIPARKASSARVACARVKRASDAIFTTKSFLFTRHRCPRVISKPRHSVNRPVHIPTFAAGEWRDSHICSILPFPRLLEIHGPSIDSKIDRRHPGCCADCHRDSAAQGKEKE